MLCALIAAAGAGCATVPGGSGWGENATLTPGWKRVRESAVNAARDPHVWVPLAGAAIFQVDNLDHRVSDWAQRETPVFGSQEDAARWSDDFRTAASVAWARIEAGAHYPSDTLFGMALGNFIGAFINDAFIGVDTDEPAQVTVHALPRGAELRLQLGF